MAENVRDLTRDQWATVEANDEYRVLDFKVGQRTWMTKTELSPFGGTPWTRQPFIEILAVQGGWGTLIFGDQDEPKRIALNPGEVVAIEPDEWHYLDTAAAGLTVVSVWEGSRGEKRFERR